MMICGIDPGLTGAIAFIEHDKVCSVEKVPVSKIKEGKTVKRYLDCFTILYLLHKHNPTHVFIEKQQSMPRQGVSSTFRTGFGYGLYIGMLIAADYDYTIVTPREWKLHYGLSSDKDMSRKKASEIFPDASHLWRQKNQDGLAEAALIAHFGANGSHPF
jgi:crossover junction endodeoxyribonuclease RuvC